MYSLSKYILLIINSFNKNVLPHSVGPDIILLKFSGNAALTIIYSSLKHDCRLPLTSIEILTLGLILITI